MTTKESKAIKAPKATPEQMANRATLIALLKSGKYTYKVGGGYDGSIYKCCAVYAWLTEKRPELAQKCLDYNSTLQIENAAYDIFRRDMGISGATVGVANDRGEADHNYDNAIRAIEKEGDNAIEPDPAT